MEQIEQNFFIQPISKRMAQDIVKAYHYLHRRAPCSKAFGFFRKADGTIAGVIMYGCGPSTTLRRGVCGPDEAGNVYELTRLWLHDELPKNCESYFISHTLPLLDKDIIVSYADPSAKHSSSSQEHVGYVYQATNWIYTGLSSPFSDPKLKSKPSLHPQSFSRGKKKADVLEEFRDDAEYRPRTRKHRYVYLKGSHKRRKELRKKLRYPELPYPKGSSAYEDSTRFCGIGVKSDVSVPTEEANAMLASRSISTAGAEPINHPPLQVENLDSGMVKRLDGVNGRKWSEETRAKISKALRGRPKSAETRAKMAQAKLGKTHSPTVREKISASLMGHVVSTAARMKIAASLMKSYKSYQGNVLSN